MIILVHLEYGRRKNEQATSLAGEQLRLEIELLTAKSGEIEPLKAGILELEARLAQYENSHTPPSLRRCRKRKKENDNKGKPGQKIGHSVTRPSAIIFISFSRSSNSLKYPEIKERAPLLLSLFFP